MQALLDQHRGERRLAMVALMAAMAIGSSWAAAWQGAGKTVPTVRYHMAFSLMRDGEYTDALKVYLDEGSHAIKTVQSRWIDSICYHTMCGECFFNMGNLPKALEHYTSAIQLYIAYRDWMLQVNFPPSIGPAAASQYELLPWG